ncbi:MAG: valyl-tRNA synthetase [Parcubacteria group bacterium Greene0714_7]|nr:MAG: valyl-tRNA synthetase [Parcubacteria group bacterium Greene0714_7]
MDPKFLQPYNSKETEEAIYTRWEESGYFNPDNLPPIVTPQGTEERAESFSMILPPPNVTGILHMGSALMLVIEDILIRHARMSGKKTLWIPGADSAAIATQSKVEGEIYKKEKKTRHDLGRDELLKRIDVFVKESEKTIIEQMKRVGASLDFSRYAYTMDSARYHAVMEAFVRMYNAGLIYRGYRIVNWDPKLQTTVSDDEMDYVEESVPFYYFKYGPFVIGTVRPETKFGDKYVVMHPDDTRYSEWKHGQTFDLEWINGPITATIIKDKAADMEMGSGVMTITPAHSVVDFEIAKRHGLDIEQVIDDRGLLLPIAGEFQGSHIKKARPLIIEKLKAKGLIDKIDEKYVHNIATNSRGGGTIEPQVKRQWFVGVNAEFEKNGKKTTLRKMMRETVESKAVDITPERYEKTYFHWIDNLRDWCISRQIWFGHRIPVWYRGEETYVGAVAPEGAGWEQDPDTLDTWFSAGLWTFSTLGWPNTTKDLKTFHPTSILETGYDILFFWVARMILMSGFLLDEVPFKKVYLHGLVRDGQGRKISKSLGNNIDPLDMAAKYGMDAVRVSLIAGMAPGTDSKISEEKIRGYKNFANKIWNIARFVLENGGGNTQDAPYTREDTQIAIEVADMAKSVSENIEKFRIDLAFDILYHFIWHRFADEIIEASKPILKGANEKEKASRQKLLYETLNHFLRLLHPFMPFVTEEIWTYLPQKETKLLMVAPWPKTRV